MVLALHHGNTLKKKCHQRRCSKEGWTTKHRGYPPTSICSLGHPCLAHEQLQDVQSCILFQTQRKEALAPHLAQTGVDHKDWQMIASDRVEWRLTSTAKQQMDA